MNVSGANLQFDVAMARQRSDSAVAGQGDFQRALRGAAGETAGQKIENRLNEAIAVSFIAPMLTDAMGDAKGAYFTNSPAEQAYAKQMYMEIATRIGQSNRLPLARSMAEAMQQRIQG